MKKHFVDHHIYPDSRIRFGEFPVEWDAERKSWVIGPFGRGKERLVLNFWGDLMLPKHPKDDTGI